jgi:hypothetical protein
MPIHCFTILMPVNLISHKKQHRVGNGYAAALVALFTHEQPIKSLNAKSLLYYTYACQPHFS